MVWPAVLLLCFSWGILKDARRNRNVYKESLQIATEILRRVSESMLPQNL